MGSPKHLWSGDWEEESAARRPPAQPPAQFEASALPAPPATPSRRRLRLGAAAVLLLAVGVAAAVILFGPGGSSPSRTASAPLAQVPQGLQPSPGTGQTPPGLSPSSPIVPAVPAIPSVPGGGQAAPGSGLTGGPAATGTAWLGVGVQPSAAGVVISGIVAGGPADAAALRPGDLLESIGNQPIRSLEDLSAVLSALNPGQTVWVRVRRGTQTIATQLTLGQNPGDSSR